MILIQVVQSASAQLTVQANPVFSTPTPSEQLLPKERLPFKGEVIEFQKLPEGEDLKLQSRDQSVESRLKTGKQIIDLEEIEIPETRYYRPWIIHRVLDSMDIDNKHSLSEEELRTRFNQINRFYPFKLHATVLQSVHEGKSKLKLNIDEKQPWQLTGTFDNQGRPGLGYYRAGVQLTNKSWGIN